MKTKLYGFLMLLVMTWACNEKEQENVPEYVPQNKGVFIDERDGTEYGWIQVGDLEWMTSNMRYVPEVGLYGVYKDQGELGEGSMTDYMFERFGYWYDYAAAMSIAPAGWRIPTDDDWKNLEQALGMTEQEVNRRGDRGTYEGDLLQQRDGGLGMQLDAGGFYSVYRVAYTNHWRFKGVYGFFWTSTEDDENDGFVYFRRIAYNSPGVYRESTMTTNWLNVRCCRDAQK